MTLQSHRRKNCKSTRLLFFVFQCLKKAVNFCCSRGGGGILDFVLFRSHLTTIKKTSKKKAKMKSQMKSSKRLVLHSESFLAEP